MNKIVKFFLLGVAIGTVAFLAEIFLNDKAFQNIENSEKKEAPPAVSVSEEPSKLETFKPTPVQTEKPKTVAVDPAKNPVDKFPVAPVEVSSNSFESLVNSSVIQLYCGSSRGTGVIIGENGEILTNRHLIYDENTRETRKDCYVLKSPFPNVSSQNPKIYYKAEVLKYPFNGRFSETFSKDKYYNDFAILKIVSRADQNSKIGLISGFDSASPEDYAVVEKGGGQYNYFPIDWNYQPKDGDILATLGYGVDASHSARQVTSTIGRIGGNMDILDNRTPQILLIESNATAGFSGGALVNLETKGLVGLISWITAGDIAGKYTVAIFRDFLRSMMMTDIDFDLKSL